MVEEKAMSKFNWETAPFRQNRSARICTIGKARLYVFRDGYHRRRFEIKINGQLMNETRFTIDEACRYAEELYEAIE